MSAYQHLIRPGTDPGAAPAPTLVLLHGYGSNMHDLFGLAPALHPRMTIISLQAPQDMWTLGLPGGRSWFSLTFTAGDIGYDAEEAHAAVADFATALPELVTANGGDPEQVYLMGFSQGAMMAHSTMLRYGGVRGIIALSGRMVPSAFGDPGDYPQLADVPVFVSHGHHDEVLGIANGRAIADFYRQTPVALTYREYQMGHDISRECLADIQGWLHRHVG
jgi:phospholipase/carboxylesterase